MTDTASPKPDRPDRKALLRKAIRAARFLNEAVTNETISVVNAMSGEPADTETMLLKEDLEAQIALGPIQVAMMTHVKNLVACSQPLKALKVIRERPVGLEDAPHLNALQVRLEAALRHVTDFAEFERRYNVPIYFSTHSLRGCPRAVLLDQKVRELRPRRMLAIGANDLALERDALDAVPEMELHTAELSTGAKDSLDALAADYPNRVFRHKMEDFYDWAKSPSDFDLIEMFEVLEHLPNPDKAVAELGELVAASGTVLISVPAGYKYIDSRVMEEAWFSHLHAFTAKTLGELLTTYFSEVEVSSGADKTLLAVCRRPK
jgi:hypothetical protein